MTLLIIVGILFLLALLVALFVPRKLVLDRGYRSSETGAPKKIAFGIAGFFLLLLGLVFALQSFYTQDSGDATVKIDFTGKIVGQETTPGLHGKLPWERVETFNVRNQSVAYAGGGQSDNSGNVATGPQITVQDADGVSSNVDINLRYSIRPDKVTDIYRQYKNEDTFKTSFIQNDVRSVVRSIPGQYRTLDLLTKRNEVEGSILQALEARWKNTGVSVDSVSLQEIRIPDSVKESYAAAVKSQIEVTKAQNELDAAKVSSQQQVVQAQAKAKANDLLSKSLNSQIIQQNYIDALKTIGENGNLVVVPQGSNPLVNISKK